MAGRFGATRGMPAGGHGGATPRFQAPKKRRAKKVRAARARRIRKNRKGR